MRNVTYYLGIGVIGMAFALTSYANMGYFKLLKSTYPDAKTLHKCIMCHEKPPTLNYYGRDFHDHNFDLKAIEGLDSDGDGVINIDEINKGTWPGVKE